MQSIGFKISGSFYDNEFVKRLLLLSDKTNNTEVTLFAISEDVVFDGSWQDAVLQFPYVLRRKREIFKNI